MIFYSLKTCGSFFSCRSILKMAVNDLEKYDLCVIGCGPGGFAAAMRALDLGKHVCIIEGGEIGGSGVMWGALAAKTMWELAKDYDIAAKVDRGYRASGLATDYQAVRNTVIQAVQEKQNQMILGMRAAGPQASNTIMSVAMLMDQGKGIKDALKTTHPHPTMSEGIQECLRLLLDKSIYKCRAFPNQIKIRSWRPDG